LSHFVTNLLQTYWVFHWNVFKILKIGHHFMKLLRKIGSYLLGDARSSERRIATLMLSVRPSVRPSVHPSICLSVCLRRWGCLLYFCTLL